MEGWLHNVQDEALKPYYQCKDQLATNQECLLWVLRVIIPPTLQAEMLNELHATHPGVVKMKELAKSTVWWPNMRKDIDNHSKWI